MPKQKSVSDSAKAESTANKRATNSPPKPRVPLSVGGLQVNACRNPRCKAFGVPVKEGERKQGPSKDRDPHYKVVGGGKKRSETGYHCNECGEEFAAKSNEGIQAELNRLHEHSNARKPPPVIGCKNQSCENFGKDVHFHPELYGKYGKTAKGVERRQCKACRKVFNVIPRSTRTRHADAHKTSFIFRGICNKIPLNRMIELADMDNHTLRRRIDFIHNQCLLFVQEREDRIRNGEVKLDRLYLSTDRQLYIANWRAKIERQHVQLMGVGTADNSSGYVFANHVNYDERVDPADKNVQAILEGLQDQDPAFRRYAQYWLESDYTLSRQFADAMRKRNKPKDVAVKRDKLRAENIKRVLNELGYKYEITDFTFDDDDAYDLFVAAMRDQLDDNEEVPDEVESRNIFEEVRKVYRAVAQRYDSEVSEYFEEGIRLPEKGMQIHAEYTQYAHFLYLSELLQHTGKVRFYLDQESGIRSAFMTAFRDRILRCEADAWYVKYLKDLDIDTKISTTGASNAKIAGYMAQHELEHEWEAIEGILKENIESNQEVAKIGKWQDLWVGHPVSRHNEPNKAMCWLTDRGQYDIDHQVKLYRRASMFGIDRFFQSARRRLSMIERGIKSASSVGRMWHGYQPYNPAMIQKMIDIFRVYYNYCLPGADGKTPAMRLGLARGPIKAERIIYFE